MDLEPLACEDDPNLDLVNMNVYIKFDEILSICAQDIGWKQYPGINQGS